jgi:hypothetical protein
MYYIIERKTVESAWKFCINLRDGCSKKQGKTSRDNIIRSFHKPQMLLLSILYIEPRFSLVSTSYHNRLVTSVYYYAHKR